MKNVAFVLITWGDYFENIWNWRACNMGGQISFITVHVCFADIAHT